MRGAIPALIVSILMCTSVTAKPKVVAHRGASGKAPENTLAAFALAWKQGADVIECDVHKTKDGYLVCMHDANTKRTAGRALSITNSTLNELRTLDVGSWKGAEWKDERIPTLTEAFTSVPDGKMIFVEIKGGTGIVPLLPGAIEASGIDESQIVVISFSKDAIRHARQMLPEVKALLLINFKYNELLRSWKPSRGSVLRDMESTGANGVDMRACPAVDEKLSKAIRDARGEIHVWTVNDAETAGHFAGLGVDSITTDQPELVRSLVDETHNGGK